MINGILIVGGTGTIGRRLAKNLAPDYPNRVIVAARNIEKARELAAELGQGVRARRVDVGDRSSVDAALADVGVVMSCVAQLETPSLLLASIANGLGYTDIAPIAMKRPSYPAEVTAEAVRTGARVILGAGLVPGISNMLARMGADCVGSVDAVETTCLLSVGDEYGADSRRYLAKEITGQFKVRINGEELLARPFTRPRRIEFAPPLGTVTARLFPFSDQIYYPATLGATTAVSRLALMPPWISGGLAIALPLIGGALAKPSTGPSRRLEWLMEWLKRRYAGLDRWGVHVEVRGARGVHRASLQGRGQADATALSASTFVRALVEGEVDHPGIWTAEQVVPVGRFLDRIAVYGLALNVHT